MTESLAQFNWVDYVFIAIFILSTLAGFVRGFFREILSILVLIAAFIVAILFSDALAVYFTKSAAGASSDTEAMSYLAIGISFGVLFTATVIIGAVISFFLSLIVNVTSLGIGNRLLGAIFGFARGFIFNLVIVFVVQLTAFGEHEVWKQSKLVALFQPAAAKLSGMVAPSLKELKEKFGGDVGKSVESTTRT